MEGLSFFAAVIGEQHYLGTCFPLPHKYFWRIVTNRSTIEFESLPYICTLLNSSLWTYYGITKLGGLPVAIVNGFGIVVETVCIALFLTFAPEKMKVTSPISFDT
ncbi:unnamed protein product [Ilex paraguariensis]|uniref:Uncharacterized protein n=1 Tax=Ilex paraguariensis TaxID=185542 RepID=A0ABC8T982_9AQUA